METGGGIHHAHPVQGREVLAGLTKAPGNTNDFLVWQVIQEAKSQGFSTLEWWAPIPGTSRRTRTSSTLSCAGVQYQAEEPARGSGREPVPVDETPEGLSA